MWSMPIGVITRGDRLDDVRRVEPPAHPHFEHGDVALRAREGDEGDERQRFEVRRHDAGALAALLQLDDALVEQRRLDQLAADRPALAQVDEMRRGVVRRCGARRR